jgi:PAS domain S-box-containing protein
MIATASALERARRRLIVRRLPLFAATWLASSVIWGAMLTWARPAAFPTSLLTLLLQGAVLTAALRACGDDATRDWVRPVVAATTVVLGWSTVWGFRFAHEPMDVLAFALLTLFLAAALLFAWGWEVELAVLGLTLAAAAPLVRDHGTAVPLAAFVTALAMGAVLSLAIAEGSKRAFATAFHHRQRAARHARELEASRDAYRDLAEKQRDFIYAGDLENRITYLNEALAAFIGAPVSELVGRFFHEFTMPHPDAADTPAVLQSIAAGEHQPRMTFALRTASGLRWVEVQPSLVEDGAGGVVGFRGIGHDVTERRDAAETLRRSQERFRRAFDSASIGMVVVGTDGRATEVNPALCEMLGYAEADLLGSGFERMTHPDDIGATVEYVSAALHGGPQAYHLEKRYRHAEGRTVWGLLSSALVRDADGAPLYFISQIQDITERKLAEEALRDSEERYRELVESQYDLISRCDADGRYVFVNDAYCRIFGLPREAIVGRHFSDFVHPDDLGPTMAEIAAGGLRDGPHRIIVENRQRTAEGWRWFAWQGRAIEDAEGRIVELRGIGRDVTERRAAEEALRGALADLRRSEERLRLLAQRQAQIREEERKRLGFDLHDNVCQELIGIAILIETLSRRLAPVPPAVSAEFTRVVRYLNELVEHLRLLARDMRPMLLRDLGLEGSLRSLADGMASPATRVRAEFPTPVPRLDEDIELAVYRIAQEALANAARHADATAIVVTLSVAAGRIVLEVCDDGRGFEAEPGTHVAALGLVSMRERALALGGVFEVVSAPGEGTLVRLDCPLVSRAVA